MTTRKGVLVGGLQPQDFVVEVDKKTLPIVSFRAVPSPATPAPPIETVLLVDAVNTRFIHVASERDQIKSFLRENQGKLAQPTSLVVLTDTGTSVTPQATLDGNQLAGFLDQAESSLRVIGRADGFYGWVEQFQISIRALHDVLRYEATRPGRKQLIWVSPGWPLLSGPEVDLTDKQRQGLFDDAASLSRLMRAAQVTLTSLDPLGTDDALGYRTTFYEEFTKGIASPRDMQFGNLGLQVLATQSGGRVLNSDNDVAKLIGIATADDTTYYTLVVQPPPSEHPNQYRAVHVTVNRQGLTARTLTGYYDHP
ncbi:MAG: VWA domain-containing protein [Acidobacteriota bacterium]|nr:VWA domain-containing protein [Acidobacteriota bacterium]